jgi:hypothetical protein
MAYAANSATITTSTKFIPQLWSDEVVATYQGKTVLANLVKQISFKGKKGDRIHIPVPARSDASVKAASSLVSVLADTAGEVLLTIDKHYEYSKLYEDIAEIQALNSMRAFYTEDAGYALAKRVDRELHKLGATFQAGSIAGATNLYEAAVIGGDGSTAFSGSLNTNTGNGTAMTDAAIRQMIQTLEDQDVDASAFVIPPVEAKVLRGISRFTEQAFVGDGNVIKTGMLGNLYGIEVFVSSQCPWIHVNSSTGTQSVNFSGTTLTSNAVVDEFGLTVDHSAGSDTKYRAGMLISKDAMILGIQQAVRTQSQYKQEYLGTLVTSDTIFGTVEARDYGALAFVVPA